MPARTSSPKRESLNLRIKPELRDLIDRARAAEEAVLERTVLTVSPEAYADFLARLEQPAQPNERLKRTMQTPASWDRP